jgi:hypothetical protein
MQCRLKSSLFCSKIKIFKYIENNYKEKYNWEKCKKTIGMSEEI